MNYSLDLRKREAYWLIWWLEAILRVWPAQDLEYARARQQTQEALTVMKEGHTAVGLIRRRWRYEFTRGQLRAIYTHVAKGLEELEECGTKADPEFSTMCLRVKRECDRAILGRLHRRDS